MRTLVLAIAFVLSLAVAAPVLAQGMMWGGDTWTAPVEAPDASGKLPPRDGTAWDCYGGKTSAPYAMMFRGGYAGLPMMSGMMWGGQGYAMHWTGLITVFLVWTTLVLVIICLMTWLSKQKK